MGALPLGSGNVCCWLVGGVQVRELMAQPMLPAEAGSAQGCEWSPSCPSFSLHMKMTHVGWAIVLKATCTR